MDAEYYSLVPLKIFFLSNSKGQLMNYANITTRKTIFFQRVRENKFSLINSSRKIFINNIRKETFLWFIEATKKTNNNLRILLLHIHLTIGLTFQNIISSAWKLAVIFFCFSFSKTEELISHNFCITGWNPKKM